MSRIRVNKLTRRVYRITGGGAGSTLRWCSKHNEPVWQYADGSFSCQYTYIVESDYSDEDHTVVDGPWEV